MAMTAAGMNRARKKLREYYVICDLLHADNQIIDYGGGVGNGGGRMTGYRCTSRTERNALRSAELFAQIEQMRPILGRFTARQQRFCYLRYGRDSSYRSIAGMLRLRRDKLCEYENSILRQVAVGLGL